MLDLSGSIFAQTLLLSTVFFSSERRERRGLCHPTPPSPSHTHTPVLMMGGVGDMRYTYTHSHNMTHARCATNAIRDGDGAEGASMITAMQCHHRARAECKLLTPTVQNNHPHYQGDLLYKRWRPNNLAAMSGTLLEQTLAAHEECERQVCLPVTC